MSRIAILLFTVALTATFEGKTGQSPSSRPLVAPFFSLEPEALGPAFFIECRNVTNTALSSASRDWVESRDAVRIDGLTLAESGGIIGPGLSQPIPPGGLWRGIVELRPTPGGTSFAVALGAHVRIPLIERLKPGRHVIAVRCLEEWSDDLPFFWRG
jgi:hypothetical protein